MRTTITSIAALFAQETDAVYLPLLTITHASLGTPIRLVADTVDLVYGGNTYTALPFDVSMPADTEDRISEVPVTIDNVDRAIVTAIRSITSPPSVYLEIVMKLAGSATSQIPSTKYRLNGVKYDATKITGTLGVAADYLNEPAVKDRFDQINAPGLF